MLTKVFLQTQFGEPHAWTEQYFGNIHRLAPAGWYLKVFTPNPWPSWGNIEIIPMTLEEFDSLVVKHCGVNPGNFLRHGVPDKLVSDYYPAYGQIFKDYLDVPVKVDVTHFESTEPEFIAAKAPCDFWAFTNWDIVYGKLSSFLPDSLLDKCDVWSDDPRTINGIFTLMRNNEYVNNLFRKVPNWERCFTIHEPCAFDEHRFTQAMRELEDRGDVRWGYPAGKFPWHSYDRLKQNTPKPELYFDSDGALIENLGDPLAMPHGHYGRELFLFHFSRTKVWPIAA